MGVKISMIYIKYGLIEGLEKERARFRYFVFSFYFEYYLFFVH